jgi:hypothetical protein
LAHARCVSFCSCRLPRYACLGVHAHARWCTHKGIAQKGTIDECDAKRWLRNYLRMRASFHTCCSMVSLVATKHIRRQRRVHTGCADVRSRARSPLLPLPFLRRSRADACRTIKDESGYCSSYVVHDRRPKWQYYERFTRKRSTSAFDGSVIPSRVATYIQNPSTAAISLEIVLEKSQEACKYYDSTCAALSVSDRAVMIVDKVTT